MKSLFHSVVKFIVLFFTFFSHSTILLAQDTTQDKKKDLIIEGEDPIAKVFFSSQIPRLYLSSEDFSNSRINTSLSTDNEKLEISTDFTLCKNDAYKSIFTVGVQAKLKDEFANITKNEKLLSNNDFGFKIKYTFKPNKSSKIALGNYSVAYTTKKTSAFTSGNTWKDAKGLANYLLDENMYESSKSFWYTLNVFIPVATTEYLILKDIQNNDYDTKSFYPFQASGGLSWYRECKKALGRFSIFGSIKNNNNINTEELDKYELQTFNSQNSNLLEKTETVHDGDFTTFITPSLKAEGIVYFYADKKLGISGSLEQNFGEYDALNWKIGLPVTVLTKDKDKEEKRLNFELAWREFNGNHYVGFNVGFLFLNIIGEN